MNYILRKRRFQQRSTSLGERIMGKGKSFQEGR